jgi:anti-sigma B factor antagonist
MKIKVHEENSVSIVALSGKLTIGEGTAALRNKVEELVEGGSCRILLNMADVTYIDSSGLGELVAVRATVDRAGGEIKLLNLGKHVHDLLKITKLYTVFEVFEDQASAIQSYSPAKAA